MTDVQLIVKAGVCYLMVGGLVLGFFAAGIDTNPTPWQVVLTVLLWPFFLMILIGVLLARFFS